ncbi:MAG: metalloregulator ArsR/SmtB family transcription factor [Streptosporangiaceae bacterium]
MPGPDVFEAIASPVRRALLDVLAGGARSVHDLAAPFEMTRPAVSQHLRVLREAGLVTEERVGRERHYGLDARPLRTVADWAGHYEPVVGLRWVRRVATAQGAAPGTEAGNQAGPVATGRAGSVTQSDQEPT